MIGLGEEEVAREKRFRNTALGYVVLQVMLK
jgi:hypothetical protein